MIVTYTGGGSFEYEKANGKLYNVSDNYRELPAEISLKELAQRARNAGYKVETYTSSQDRELQKKRTMDRKETDKFLNYMYLRDKDFVRGSRVERIANRTEKRRRK